jgi:hypothetical protein
LTPASTRRTLYGKVSRYSLDSYLQLFDFPSPAQSAEKRFTTTVPLQRLFFMNSDFMQQQAELIARRVTPEPDNRARIDKAYRLILGRAPTSAEVAAGLAYLTTEPLKAYDERRAAKNAKPTDALQKSPDGAADAQGADDPGADAPSADGAPAEDMMAGVLARPDQKLEEVKKLASVTPWGRYLKVLLSSSEFLFVN